MPSTTNQTDGVDASDELLIGYIMFRECDNSTWLYLGCTPEEAGQALANEFDGNEGLSLDEIASYVIEARHFTRDELDNMPDFPGW